jgi:general transcription factor 3C polypeptide 5 (transcription factor C subunit 1)
MPDLQYSATHDNTMVKLRDHVLPMKCKHSTQDCPPDYQHVLDSEVKNYSPNTTAGANLTMNVGPSAEFVQMPIAFNYR